MKVKAVLAVSLVVGVAYAATSSATPSRWTVERYYASETWSSFADVGAKGAGPGDVYTSQQALRSADGTTVGVLNGYGLNLHKPYVYFHWTAALGGGTLTLESALDLRMSSATYPIDGGSGRYAGVRGTVTVTDAGKNRSLAIVRYER